MGWKLPIQGMPEGYIVEEDEDGLTLRSPRGRVVAEYGPMVSSLDLIVRAAWDDVGPPASPTRNTVLPQASSTTGVIVRRQEVCRKVGSGVVPPGRRRRRTSVRSLLPALLVNEP
jgi:hypothetical protein